MGDRVIYARTEDGLELPVLDMTNSAFAASATEAELEAMSTQFIKDMGNRPPVTLEMQEAFQKSIFGKAIMEASRTFLDGVTTYRMKLGADFLPTNANAVDKAIMASFPVLCVKLRVRDMALLLAEGLAARLESGSNRGVLLVNIGGGPAADDWNALVALRNEFSEKMAKRDFRIAVLDMDTQGPAFGARAIEALREAGSPLRGMQIGFQHFGYDWRDAQRLQEILGELRAADRLCAMSSEGALFEYGSDEEIVANLKQLHEVTAADTIVVGSVTRTGDVDRAASTNGRVATRPRTMEQFKALAENGGWRVEKTLERPFSYNVRMVKK